MRFVRSLLWSIPMTVLVSAAVPAFAAVVVFEAVLSGASEDPPNASAGVGMSRVDFDTVAQTMRVRAEWSGLTGTTTVAHIHGPTAVAGSGNAGVMTSVPTFPGFPTGVMAGTYDQTFDMADASSYNPTFLTTSGGTVAGGAAALFASLSEGRAYPNIHSSLFAAGEIRGFYAVVPIPGTLPLLVSALVGLVAVRRGGRGNGSPCRPVA